MTNEDYMLMLGSNVYADTAYTLSYQAEKNIGDKTHLFTIENSENGLILTAEIRDENSGIIAKIDKNEFIQVNDDICVEGEVEKGNGLTLTRKKDGTVLFSARITEDQYIAVSGVFYVEGKKIYVTDRKMEINDVPRQTVNGVNVHDVFFVGTYDITLTDNGVVF